MSERERGRPRRGRAGPARRTGSPAAAARRRFSYTEPSPGRYPWQWYWDSCFAAIVWRRFEPARARAELESLLAAQRPDGFVGHTIFWRSRVSCCGCSSTTSPTASAEQTESIQPPLLAWAWRIAVGDPREEPRIAAHRWSGSRATATSRATACSGSSSPTSPGSTPRRSSKRSGDGGRTAGSASRCWSTATAGSAGTRGGSATRAGPSSANRSSTRSGRSRCRRWGGRRRRRRWSTASGTSGAASSSTRRSRAALRPQTLTWASLAPLALPDLPEEIGRRLVEEHLLNRARVPHPGRAALGRGRRARLRTRRRPRPDPPLLARADLGQLRLAGLARPAPARLRGRGGAAGRAA